MAGWYPPPGAGPAPGAPPGVAGAGWPPQPGWPPGFAGYGPPPPLYPPTPPRPTNDFSIAALVTSLLWLGGVGGILGVVFGIVAHRQIRRSEGRETGEGLATAGIVIGAVGILMAIAMAVLMVIVGFAISRSVHTALSPSVFDAGRTVTISSADPSGVDRITVYGARDVPAPISGLAEARGIAVSAQVCAGRNGAPSGLDASSFLLRLSDGTSLWPVSDVPLPGADLAAGDPIAAGTCVAGDVGFSIPARQVRLGAVPTRVLYNPELFDNDAWRLPRATASGFRGASVQREARLPAPSASPSGRPALR